MKKTMIQTIQEMIQNQTNDGKYHRQQNVELRSIIPEEENDFFGIDGKAVTFNDETVLFRFHDSYENVDYEIREVIDPGAFNNCDMSDVLFDLNHDWNRSIPLARTRNKSLGIEVRADGVWFTAKCRKSNQEAVKVRDAISDGLLDRCSFMFTTPYDGVEYTEHRAGDQVTVLRRVVAIDKLFDLSVVNVPAYDNTSIEAKSMDARSLQDLERFLNKVETERAESRRKELTKKLEAIKI